MAEEITKSKAPPLERMSDEALRTFVDDFVSGRIYSGHHVPEGASPLDPFLILRLAGLPEGWQPEDIGTVYEYINAAGPLAVNGMPTFLSCRFIHIDDWQRAVDLIQKEEDRRKNIDVGREGDEHG